MKTVYVLGAGASCEAGFPPQRQLLGRIFDNSTVSELSSENAARMRQHREALRTFIADVFTPDEVDSESVALEDILTVIDRALANGETVQRYTPTELARVRRDLIEALALVFLASWRKTDLTTTLRFAFGATINRLRAGQRGDPLSIISTNWDQSLDLALSVVAQILKQHVEQLGAKDVKGPRVDYCTYTHPLEPTVGDVHFPSVQLKSRGYHNVKLIKPHGSFNWHHCPSCIRLFVGETAGAPAAALIEGKVGRRRHLCPKCRGAHLNPLMVTPTYMKDLNNTHLRSVWHNALTELSEAGRVVFIGYSLPNADFELRYLLAKGVKPTAGIEVVLDDSVASREAAKRYRSFFGSARTRISYRGFRAFVPVEFPRSWFMETPRAVQRALSPWYAELGLTRRPRTGSLSA